jgi:glycerophosphoryl diester phosphodiesterase
MKIIPWTVNTKKEIDILISLGVDGLISDYPNLF